MRIKKGTYEINLKLSETELWNNVHKKNRWSVQKAKKGKVVITENSIDKEACYKLYLAVCEHNKATPNDKVLFSNHGKFFVALFNGKTVACSVVRVEGERAVLSYNAADYEYRNTEANSLLYWEVMLYYKMKGYCVFDLGGADLYSKDRRGNDRFKARWGGKLVLQEQNVSFLAWVWWKYLRHVSLLRYIKARMKVS